jgi:hypothetical protein
MKSLQKLPKYIVVWMIALVAVTTLMIVASPRLRNGFRRQETKPEVPKVISKVKDLEVISQTIDYADETSPVVVIEIRNNSDLPVIAISVESGDEKDASAISTVGLQTGDEPAHVVLAPHGIITMRMPVGSILPGKPFKIAAVIYADETEDGEKIARESLRRQREQDKERYKAKGSPKEGEPQQ